jgi:putative transposase
MRNCWQRRWTGGESATGAPSPEAPQRLCADAGYQGAPAQKTAQAHGDQPQIKQRREEAEAKKTSPEYRARRWAVERTPWWLYRFRKLLVSFEKTEEGYVALLTLAAAMICWRQTIVIYG